MIGLDTLNSFTLSNMKMGVSAAWPGLRSKKVDLHNIVENETRRSSGALVITLKPLFSPSLLLVQRRFIA